jgi:dTDP-4-amino-4,6-dideoxygalactose transaminase
VGSRAGGREFISALAQWMLARPALFAIPSSIPWLQLGEMVYHELKTARPIARSSTAVVRESLRHEQDETAVRRTNAARLDEMCARSKAVQTIRCSERGSPSYLRFPVLIAGVTSELPRCLGVARGYPLLLFEQPEVARCLKAPNTAQPGALRLRERLVTLPTHSLLAEADFRALRDWLGSLN